MPLHRLLCVPFLLGAGLAGAGPIDPRDPDRQILGTDQGAVVTLNGGRTWSSWYNQSTAQIYRVSTDSRFPYWVYGAQQDSGGAAVPSRTTGIDGIKLTQFREITAGGESHNIVPDPRDPQVVYGGTVEKLDLRTMQTQSVDPTLAEPGEYRSAWTLPLAFSRRDPRVLYFANQKLFRTEDGGRHWAAISPDLTRDDFRPYVYRTRDGGRTWTLAVDGIPSNEAVNVVRADPVRRGLLYAGTERGVHVSFDDGESWQSLKVNLPVTSVRDIDVHGDDVVIATHGRGFWILDDVSPLRQAKDVPAEAPSWLFRPAVARRLRADVWEGTPFPKDEPMAPNPPAGAYLDYVLRTPPRGPVVLEIAEAASALVRRYSSTDAPRAYDPRRTLVAAEWFRTPSSLATTVGMHRFVWPLHYPALAGGDAFADGVWAPPGEYTVTLVVDGQRQSQPLTVAPDPRVALAPEAYRAQFELAREVEALQAEVTAGSESGRVLIEALAERRKTAAGELAAEMARLETRAWELAGSLPSSNRYGAWWRAPRSETSWRFLAETLQGLATAIDGADAEPTPDARAGVAKAGPALDRVRRAQAGLERERAALDARLVAAGQPPLNLTP